MNIFYYDIAVSIPLRQCFTYKFDTKIKKGTRVAVPFGKRVLVGVIVRNIQKPDALDSKSTIKSILNIQMGKRFSIRQGTAWCLCRKYVSQ